MREFFFVVLSTISLHGCLANYRYGLMNGQMPLGDESASTTSISVQECGKFCGDSNSLGLMYHTGTSTCACYSRVLGFADIVDSSQAGYIQVDDTYTSCLSVAQHQAIIVNMVYGGGTCPPNFDELNTYCCGDALSLTEAECKKYGEFFHQYAPGDCDIYKNGDTEYNYYYY